MLGESNARLIKRDLGWKSDDFNCGLLGIKNIPRMVGKQAMNLNQ